MYDTKKYFPKNVWEPTRNGWISRPVTKADTVRREQYLADFSIRQEEKDAQRKQDQLETLVKDSQNEQ